MRSNKTSWLKKGDLSTKWYIIDAQGQTLGRLASKISNILRGKNKATYIPNMDNGSSVIVTNASKINVTGKKKQKKTYYRYSGYPGGLKSTTLDKLLEKHPDRVIRFAVKGMLPKNKLQKVFLKKLRIYPGDCHNHQAQTPESI